MKTHSILLGAILAASAMPVLAQSTSAAQGMKMDQSAQDMQMKQNPSDMKMMMDCMHMREGMQSGQGMQGMSTGRNMPCKDQTAQGVGVVKAIDTAKGTITIHHEAIPSIHWPAMTMTFKADPRSLLKSVKVGEKVGFTLHPNSKDSTVTAIVAQP